MGVMLGFFFGFGISMLLFLMGIFLSKIFVFYRKFFNFLFKILMGVFGFYIFYMGIMFINYKMLYVMYY